MARMMRENFRRRGPCHPWCAPMELVKGRARENREWRSEVDAEVDARDAYYPFDYCISLVECRRECAYVGQAC